VDGPQREGAGAAPTQRVPDPARAELSASAQRQAPAFCLRKDFLLGAAMRTATP